MHAIKFQEGRIKSFQSQVKMSQNRMYDLETEQAECMRQLLGNQLFIDYVREDYGWRKVSVQIFFTFAD